MTVWLPEGKTFLPVHKISGRKLGHVWKASWWHWDCFKHTLYNGLNLNLIYSSFISLQRPRCMSAPRGSSRKGDVWGWSERRYVSWTNIWSITKNNVALGVSFHVEESEKGTIKFLASQSFKNRLIILHLQASESVGVKILCSSKTLTVGFRGSEIVKWSVGEYLITAYEAKWFREGKSYKNLSEFVRSRPQFMKVIS